MSLGYLNSTSIGCIKKIMEQNVEKIEHFIAHTIPDLVNVFATITFMFIILFFFKWLDGIHRSIMHTFKYRNAIF